MHGLNPGGKEAGRVNALRAAQRNVCRYPEFQNNTAFVPTAQYAVLNGTTYNGIHHYFGRADTYFHIGQAFGRAMHQLVQVDADPITNHVIPSRWNSSGSSSVTQHTATATSVSTSRARRTYHHCLNVPCLWFALPLLLLLFFLTSE